jgi:transposase
MFIRRTLTRRSADTSYSTYRLVRSERVGARVVQKTLLNLGAQFDLPESLWKPFCQRLADLLSPQVALPDAIASDALVEAQAQRCAALLLPNANRAHGSVQRARKPAPASADAGPAPQQSALFEPPQAFAATAPATSEPAPALWADATELAHLDARSIGVESSAGFNGISLAAAMGQLVARMAHPASERRTHAWLQQRSGLGEVLGFDFARLSLTRLYAVGSQLWSAKSTLESALYTRLQAQLGLSNTVALYDLTNTYFEGLCQKNPSAVRGHSKEGRSGAPLMSLGLVLDQHGFAQRSEVYSGNVREASTVEHMLSHLSAPKGALVVLDRGFVSEATLTWLNANGYRYLVMSKERRDLGCVTHSLENAQGDTITIERCEIETEFKRAAASEPSAATSATDPKTESVRIKEAVLRCHSPTRALKESAMVSLQRNRMQTQLDALKAGLSTPRGAKTSAAVHQRLGRIRATYPSVARHFSITLEESEGKVTALHASYQAQAHSKAQLPGHYTLRTNDLSLSAEQMWRTYIRLTDVESVFRSLKSELGLRPVFHQAEIRCKAHLWISVLAYQCVQYVRHQLKACGQNDSWHTLREHLNAHQRIWSRMPLASGGHVHIHQNQVQSAKVSQTFAALGVHALKPRRHVVSAKDF